MPPLLEPLRFCEADLPLVENFYCGDEPWSVVAAEWIRAPAVHDPGALYSVANRGNEVFLYFDGPQLVGFGSLGKCKWSYPGRKDQRIEFSYIPQVALAADFQRKPAGAVDGERYSDAVIQDLIGRANLHGLEMLALQVSTENLKAIRLYQRYDFREIEPLRSGFSRFIRVMR